MSFAIPVPGGTFALQRGRSVQQLNFYPEPGGGAADCAHARGPQPSIPRLLF